jgi:predicted RNA-binding protein with PUA-like domain
MRHWLMKSEPSTYSIDDLARDGRTTWDGVRNYQARNMMRDDMSLGDPVLFYHSSADPPGVAGVAKVARTGYPDGTAWDKSDAHYDPDTDPNNPTWMMVDIEFVEKLPRFVSLDELQGRSDLDGLMVVKRACASRSSRWTRSTSRPSFNSAAPLAPRPGRPPQAGIPVSPRRPAQRLRARPRERRQKARARRPAPRRNDCRGEEGLRRQDGNGSRGEEGLWYQDAGCREEQGLWRQDAGRRGEEGLRCQDTGCREDRWQGGWSHEERSEGPRREDRRRQERREHEGCAAKAKGGKSAGGKKAAKSRSKA